jgi:hypothetical protein
LILLFSSPAWAIEVQPNPAQIEAALEQGRAAATARIPPIQLYPRFGSPDDIAPHGLLMTKLAGLAVMSAHFALRSERPTEHELRQVLDDRHLTIRIMLFGERPDFAVDAYVVLTQNERTIAPVKVRVDATADRTPNWPQSPAFRAKVIASFAYDDFDPRAKTRLSVFPRGGGETAFDLDFAAIP